MHRFGLLAVLLGAAAPAFASPVTVPLGGVSFFDQPYTYDFGGGNSITFTTVDKSFFAYDPAGVSTGGTVQIASLGPPFYATPQPTSYFTNRGGSFGPGANTAQFVSYATPTAVPYSISEGLVGLRFDLGRGYQYGYADIAGSTLYGLRFESDPGVALPFGAVPEAASWVLMVAGFGLVGLARRRQAVAA